MRLRLITNSDQPPTGAFEPRRYDLNVHPLRPGVAHDQILLSIPVKLSDRVEAAAASEGLPTMLWSGIAIESQRAVSQLASDVLSAEKLAADLDDAAANMPAGPLPHRGRRLVRYARAIRSQPARSVQAKTDQISVAVAHHTLIAWERAAMERGETVEGWAGALLAALPEGRAQWEAAAAELGQTLSEWIAVHAARRSSR